MGSFGKIRHVPLCEAAIFLPFRVIKGDSAPEMRGNGAHCGGATNKELEPRMDAAEHGWGSQGRGFFISVFIHEMPGSVLAKMSNSDGLHRRKDHSSSLFWSGMGLRGPRLRRAHPPLPDPGLFRRFSR